MSSDRPSIIDVHLHAMHMEGLVQPNAVEPSHNFQAPSNEEEYMKRCLSMLEKFNIRAVTSGPIEVVRKWRKASPERIIPGTLIYDLTSVDIDNLRQLISDGELAVMCEIIAQPFGYSPSDPELEPLFSLAEETDIPLGIHMGPAWPGMPYMGAPKYRASLSNPLLLEDALLRHPDARVYVCHAGWPMISEMINLLYSHPQVYVDVGVIDWFMPRTDFHFYLKRIVDAGFCDRIMYGSDQMVWVDAIPLSIDYIESANFLSDGQKRDIFYNNSKRFLRL
jgi:predicted TIM-barrel fold metal-dependent hydrolase